MSDKHFDDLFKQSFSGYSPDVPGHIWENIAAGRKNKRPVGFWLNKKAAILLAAAGLVLLSGGAYFIFNKKENGKAIALENNGSGQETGNTNPAAVLENNKKDDAAVADNTNGQQKTQDINVSSATGINTAENLVNKPSGDKTTGASANTFNNQKDRVKQRPGKKPGKAGTRYYNATFNNGPGIIVEKGDQAAIGINELTNDITADKEQEGIIPAVDGMRELIRLTAENNISKQTIKPFTPAVKISEECPGAPTNKYYFDFYISPDYAIKKYSDTGVSSLVAKRKESLRFHSAYSAGMRYTRVFNNGMSVRTGINFSQVNEKFSFAKDNVVQIVYVINTQGDTTDSYYVRGTRYKTSYNNYRTIDVPLVVGYEMGNERLRANINAGALVNIYSWQSGETLDNDGNPVVITTGKANNPYQYKTNVGIGFTAGASLYYKLNNRFYAMAEPYFRYNFSPMNRETLSIQERFTTIGLRLGIRMDIK